MDNQTGDAPEGAGRRVSSGAKRSVEAESAVLAAARDLLVEKGWAGFSIEAVARRASAGKPTIYRWWPSKADLFLAVYIAEKDDVVVVQETGDLVADLVRYTEGLWSFWRDHPAGAAFRGLVAEAQGGGAVLDILRDKFLPERLAPVRDLFARAAARGALDVGPTDICLELWIGFNWLRLLTDRLSDPECLPGVIGWVCGGPGRGR